MMNNWNSLPDAIKNFKTPHSDLIVVKTETEGLYQVYQLCANADQKFTISTAGRITSNSNVLVTEMPHNYNATTDTWEQPENRTYGVYKYIMGNLSQSAANEDSIVYSTVDFYDSKYTTLLRERDEKVNCSVTDYYTFDPNLLISEVKAVLDLDTDAIIAITDTANTARVKLYIIKDAVNNQIKLSIDSSSYFFYFNSAAEVREFVIKRNDYSLYSSSVSSLTKLSSISATKGSLRGLVEFISHDVIGYKDESLLVFPAQELDLTITEILPESITATPATIEDLIGTTHQLSVEVLPAEAEDKSVSFSSNNNQVATVDENGLVTLKGEGTAIITITSKRVPELSTQVMITAIRPYEKPVINRLSITPGLPTERDQVEFNYDVTYDRSTFKAEEWENKQTRYEAGRHTVRVRVQDSNDLWSDWFSFSFNVAAVYQEPVISNLRMTPEAPGYGEAVEFTYDCVLDPRLTLQKENWTNKKASYLDGNHTVKLSITDSEGQTSNELSLSFSIERPYDQPSISNLRMTPSNPQPGETVSFSYDKNLDSRLQVKQENWVNKKSSYEAGTHTVKLTVTDTADQTSNELSLTFSTEQPLEAPVISNLRIDPATPNAGETVSFIYDKVIDERLTLKTENWVGKQDTYEAGQHTVTLSITDSADQVSNTLSLTFEVVYVPEMPVLNSIAMTPTTPIAGDAVNFTYQATLDPKATVQEEIWEGKQESYEAGDHEVALTLVDSFNQRSNRQTFAFTVLRRKDQPVISNLRMTPANPTTEDEIIFTYDAVLDPELTLLSENWVNKQSSYEAGTHTVSLTITDSDNQVSNELSLTFEVKEVVVVPPADEDPITPEPDGYPFIYEITVDPPHPRVGELLSYTYTVALAKDSNVKTINWTGKQAIYYEPGLKTVTLEVIDDRGLSATKTIEVEVGEASETPQPPKPIRVKHLEVTRWDSASKRFLILEGREK